MTPAGAAAGVSVRAGADEATGLSNTAAAIVAACEELANAFRAGATLFVAGSGLAAADAQHVAVEFVHPVIVGKPSLPAISLAANVGVLTAALAGGAADGAYAQQLEVLARPGDVLLALIAGKPDPATTAALESAGRRRLLRIALVGGEASVEADHVIRCAGVDARAEKEARVTAYHLLWEITHVALEQQSGPGPAPTGGTGPTCLTCADEAVAATVVEIRGDGLALVELDDTVEGRREIDVSLVDARVGSTVLVHADEAITLVDQVKDAPGEPTVGPAESAADPMTALYPFLSGEANVPAQRDIDLRRSTLDKIDETVRLRAACLLDNEPAMRSCAAAIADRLRAGGRLLIFGNGGSSTDAQTLADLFLAPGDGKRPLPAIALTTDIATVTALANDVGFAVVFARQISAVGRSNDIAIALSTSGSSDNLLRGLNQARARGLLTVGFAGGEGGRMVAEHAADHLFVVRSNSVHRIQEAQTTLYGQLWRYTHSALQAAKEEARP